MWEPGQGTHWSTTAVKCWVNSMYQVTLYIMPPAPQRGGLPAAQLSIKRHDKGILTEWRDLQRIKDEILGTSVEAVQLFPSAKRIVDTSNAYHLWALPANHWFPIGYDDGRVIDTDPEVAEAIEEARKVAEKSPNYHGGAIQSPRKPHHTDEGLPEVGLAGMWWVDPVRIEAPLAALFPTE